VRSGFDELERQRASALNQIHSLKRVAIELLRALNERQTVRHGSDAVEKITERRVPKWAVDKGLLGTQ
jgi:hypothetical protein